MSNTDSPASSSPDTDARKVRDAGRQVSGGRSSPGVAEAGSSQLQEVTGETTIQQCGSMDGKVDHDAAWEVSAEDAKVRSEESCPQVPDYAYPQEVRDYKGNRVTAYLPVREIMDRHAQFWAEGGRFLQRREDGGRNALKLRVVRTFEGHPGILVDNKSACRSYATPVGCSRDNCHFLHADPGCVVSSLPSWGFHLLGTVSSNDPCMTNQRTLDSLQWSAMDLADIQTKSERAVTAMERANRAHGMVNQATAQWHARIEVARQQRALVLNQASERAATQAIGYQGPAGAELPSLESGNAAAIDSQMAIAPSVATVCAAPPVHAKPEPANATGNDSDLRAQVAILLARLEGYEAKGQQPNRPPRLSRRQRKRARQEARPRQVTPPSPSTDSSRSPSSDRKAHNISRGSRRRSRDRDSRSYRSRDRERSRGRDSGRRRSRRERGDSRSRGHRKADRRSRSSSRRDSSSHRRGHHDDKERRSRSRSRYGSRSRRRDHHDDTSEDSRGSDSGRASIERTPERSKKERK